MTDTLIEQDRADVDLSARMGDAGVDASTTEKFIELVGDPRTLFVISGACDLFVIESSVSGRWHAIGTLGAGTGLYLPQVESANRLVARPARGSRVKWLTDEEIQALIQASPDEDASSRRAVCDWLERGLVTVLSFLQDGLAPREFVPLEKGRRTALAAGQSGRLIDGLAWVGITGGVASVCGALAPNAAGATVPAPKLRWAALQSSDWISAVTDAEVEARSTLELFDSGELQSALADFLLHVVKLMDGVVAGSNERDLRSMEEGRESTERVSQRADRALAQVLDLVDTNPLGDSGTDEDATAFACRLVTASMGIPLLPPEGNDGQSRTGPIERIAIRSRLRTRTISLMGEWWTVNHGPLVAHRSKGLVPVALLWRRGRYHAFQADAGTPERLSRSNAHLFEPRAVIFYRPIPDKAPPAWKIFSLGLRGGAKDAFALVAGCSAAVSIAAAVPVATGIVLGDLVPNGKTGLIVQLCLLLIWACLISASLRLLQNFSLLRLEGRFEATAQAAVWDRLLRLPARFFQGYSTGDLANSALGVSRIRATLSEVLTVVVYGSCVAIVNVVILMWYDPALGLVACGLMLASVLVFIVLGSFQAIHQARALEMDYKLIDRVFQMLRGLAKLKAAAAERRAYSAWALEYAERKRIEKRVGRYQGALFVFNTVFLPLCSTLLFWLLLGPARGAISVPHFAAFFVAFSIALGAVLQVTSAATRVVQVIPTYRRLRPLLTQPVEVASSSSVPGELTGRIEVSHVSFAYVDDGPPVLDDVSFRVSAGEFVAIVGSSGCGKSTLLRLLLGFETASSGAILYDGRDLSSLDVGAVRRQCGVVLQQSRLFRGSILQAIAGPNNYSLDEIWEAAEMSGIAGDIREMPMGLHTLITDGSAFSGGQRQRLAVAQALISKPRLLFLDEATSALDNHSQRIVTSSAQRLNATRIVVAHRLSTVMDADRVIVLDQGKVVQNGPPEQLLKDMDGRFFQLVRRQL